MPSTEIKNKILKYRVYVKNRSARDGQAGKSKELNQKILNKLSNY